MTMLKLKIQPPTTSGVGQETSHCSEPLAARGQLPGERRVEAELRVLPGGDVPEASERTWISVRPGLWATGSL